MTSYIFKKILEAKLKENKESASKEDNQLNEIYFDHKALKVGDTVHPYTKSRHGNRINYLMPHTVTKKTQTYTELKSQDGSKVKLSHATGSATTNNSTLGKYELWWHGIHTQSEKDELTKHGNTQNKEAQNKGDAIRKIKEHLDSLVNSHGHAVRTLSPEHHEAILGHLQTLLK